MGLYSNMTVPADSTTYEVITLFERIEHNVLNFSKAEKDVLRQQNDSARCDIMWYVTYRGYVDLFKFLYNLFDLTIDDVREQKLLPLVAMNQKLDMIKHLREEVGMTREDVKNSGLNQYLYTDDVYQYLKEWDGESFQ